MKLSLHRLLWTADPNPKGQYPIYIRITISRKTVYLATGEFIYQKQWSDKEEQVKNHPLAVDINARIGNLVSSISRKFTELSLAGKTVSAKELKGMFTGGKSMNNVFDFADKFTIEVQHKRSEATLESYRKNLRKLEAFQGSRNLTFEEITTDFLFLYEQHLRSSAREVDTKEKGGGLGNNYVHSLFKHLKMLFNAAIKRGIVSDYPFDRYENPVYTAPVKDYFTMAEIKKVEELADTTDDLVLKQTAVYFLLGVSTGLRISDWRKFKLSKHIADGKVLLRATKNGEWLSMPINAILRRNMRRMLAFPLTIEEPVINRRLKELADKIGAKKHVTSHTGRHTFAITLCADRGVSSETCAELMGITVKTCVENYYRVTNRKIDKETLAAWKGL